MYSIGLLCIVRQKLLKASENLSTLLHVNSWVSIEDSYMQTGSHLGCLFEPCLLLKASWSWKLRHQHLIPMLISVSHSIGDKMVLISCLELWPSCQFIAVIWWWWFAKGLLYLDVIKLYCHGSHHTVLWLWNMDCLPNHFIFHLSQEKVLAWSVKIRFQT